MKDSSARHCVRILSEVRRDIDSFLDPSVLALVCHGQSDVKRNEAKRTPSELAAVSGVAESNTVHGTSSGGLPADDVLDVLDLRCKNEALQSELAGARCEANLQRVEFERRAGRDAATLVRLTHERDELKRGGRAKKRRLDEAESMTIQLQDEKDALVKEQEQQIQRCQQKFLSQQKESSAEQQRLQGEISGLRKELSAARATTAASISPGVVVGVPTVEVEALRKRVLELEHEAESLRLALQQAQPEHDIGEQLRKRHEEYQDELQQARGLQQQLREAQAKVLALEQDNAGLHASLTAQNGALSAAEEAVQGTSLVKRDLSAFVIAASAIVSESNTALRSKEAQDSSADDGERSAFPVTPTELSLAWARLQTDMHGLRQRGIELQRCLDEAKQQERQTQTEAQQSRCDLASAQGRCDELQMAARRAREESAVHAARVSVLREALARGVSTVVETGAEPCPELEAASRHAADLAVVVEAKEQALQQVTEELKTLRKNTAHLADAKAAAAHLEQVNAELRDSNRELERRQDRLVAEVDKLREQSRAAAFEPPGAAGRRYGSATARALSPPDGPGQPSTREAEGVAEGPHGKPARQLLTAEDAHDIGLQAPTTTRLDYQHAVQELDHFRKATRKYVQEFREGLYGLLGWKVEMRREGEAMQWHLTSKFHEDRALAFQLKPGEIGCPAHFDLLATPWSEQLQDDRQAMAYLEVQGSIPGFLAHLTIDSFAQRPLLS